MLCADLTRGFYGEIDFVKAVTPTRSPSSRQQSLLWAELRIYDQQYVLVWAGFKSARVI
jgi:hypothetical protein